MLVTSVDSDKAVQIHKLIWVYMLHLPKYFDTQAWANSVGSDQTLQTAASNQGLVCLPLIEQFLDIWTGETVVQILCEVWLEVKASKYLR